MAGRLRQVFAESANTKASAGSDDWFGGAGRAGGFRLWHGHLHSIDGQGVSLRAAVNGVLYGRVCQRCFDARVAGRKIRLVPSGRSRGGKLDCDGC